MAGGPPVTLVQAPGLTNFVWADDGSLIYQAEQNLWRAGETGGNAVPIAQGLTGRVQSLDVLPGGDLLLSRFPAGTISAARSEIVVRSIADGRETVVVTGGIEAHYVPTGHLLLLLEREPADGALRFADIESHRGATAGGGPREQRRVANISGRCRARRPFACRHAGLPSGAATAVQTFARCFGWTVPDVKNRWASSTNRATICGSLP